MSPSPLFPSELTGADFVVVRYLLEFQDSCRLAPYALLGLRRKLLCAGRELFGPRAQQWFDPPLTGDPVARRRFQKPAPAFVLRPLPLQRFAWDEGDTLELEVLYLGSGLQQMDSLLASLRQCGRRGLSGDGGRFEIPSTVCLQMSGNWQSPRAVASTGTSIPDVLSAGWWLDTRLPLTEPLLLNVSTPARLLADGHLLRRPRFVQLFPFMLRRVTSMLYYHCGLEVIEDHAPLFAAARRVEADWGANDWVDWQERDSDAPGGRLGGLTGKMRLSGTGLEELGWVIAIASLLGIGRGASFGAGRLDLPS